MKFSVNIPLAKIDGDGEFQTPDAVQSIAAALEASHAHAGNMTDHPAPDAHWLHNDPAGHDALDPFTGLAFIAASTRRLLLQTAIVVLPYRNPFITAKAAATLHVLSGGRLILGVGAGYQKAEFDALGVPFGKRGAMSDEALETIRLAWAGGAVVKKGFNFNAAGNEPRPALPLPPKIWVGGGSDKAVERAARWGDGWHPFLSRATNDVEIDRSSTSSVAELGRKIKWLQEMRAEMGKPPADIMLSPPFFPANSSRAEVDKYCDALAEFEALGVGWVTAVIRKHRLAEYLDTLAWFNEEVMAKFATRGKPA